MRHGARRLSWGLFDQGANSLTTLCVSVGALQGPKNGATEFAVIFLMYTLAVGFSRSITTEPVAQDLALMPVDHVRAFVRVAGLTGALVGLGTALLAAVLVRPDTALGLWSLALPLSVVATDSIRAAWIGARQPTRAVPYSGAQLAAAAAGLTLTFATGNSLWSLAPLVMVSALLALAGVLRGPAICRRQLLPHHWYYAAEWLSTSGLAQSSGLVVAAQGLPVLPLLIRAQGVLFGPLTSLAQAVAALAVPELAALRRRRPALVLPAMALSGFLMITSAVYTAALLVVPEGVLSHLLGQTWLEFRPVLVPAIVAVVLAGGSMGPFVALRAHGYARASLGAKVVRGIAGLLLPLLGVQVIGLSGYFWGSAAASALGAVWSLGTLRRAERHAPVEPVGTPG